MISVSDKQGLEPLARALVAASVEVVATGATAEALRAWGVSVLPVEQVSGFPEILGGRVKTLHPAIHAGLLADADNAEHQAQLADLGLTSIDLAVVNFYPFDPNLPASEQVEQIDIGGPTLVRAAAKNHGTVAVLTSPVQYPEAIAAIVLGGFTRSHRSRLAVEAFARVAEYDVAIANAMSVGDDQEWPLFLGTTWRLVSPLRYGENPHQPAALYRDSIARLPMNQSVANVHALQGKAMSYNNYVDASAGVRAVAAFADPCVAIIKHSNPSGVACAEDVALAHARARASDPDSAFGSVIAVNRAVTAQLARQVAETFTEVLLAPEFDVEALEILRSKPSMRVLAVDPVHPGEDEMHPVAGGLLVQRADRLITPVDQWRHVAGPPASVEELKDLDFAWRTMPSVKSNAIVIASARATVGIGMGQVSRVDAARLAVLRAGDRALGAVAASDAFFPFPDGVEVLASAGVRAIVQPGGSIRDEEVIAAAEAAGLSMYLTGVRHFWH